MRILLFLGLVFIFFLLYGMSTSAKTVVRSAKRARAQLETQGRPAPVHGCNHVWLQDVNSLFALYQSGALTREEFDGAKRHLLARLHTST